jgi:hypothetical protein
MSYSVEVKGKSADRFRAYGQVDLTRKPSIADHVKAANSGKPFKAGDRVSYKGADVVAEGKVTGSSVTVPAGKTQIERVVFYKGDVADERVVGSIDVNATGEVKIDLVEPPEEEAKG